MDPILATIKDNFGIDRNDTSFDVPLLTYINSTFLPLSQVGVSPVFDYLASLQITESDTWGAIFLERTDLGFLKTLISLKVKLAFDPPSTSYVADTFRNQISVLEWNFSLLK
jgi:hypothetical protein